MSDSQSKDYATVSDLAVLEVGDVSVENFDVYAVAVSGAGDTVSHAFTVLYEAFHALHENSTDAAFGKRVGLVKSRVSELKLFSAARGKGISHTARGKMARQAWSRLISGANRNSDVRAAIRDSDTSTADVVKAISAAWKIAHAAKPAEPDKGKGDDDGDKRGTDGPSTPETFGSVLDTLKDASKRLPKAGAPKRGELASAENVLKAMLADVAALAAGENSNATARTSRQGRAGKAA